jgi:hypothetical protein
MWFGLRSVMTELWRDAEGIGGRNEERRTTTVFILISAAMDALVGHGKIFADGLPVSASLARMYRSASMRAPGKQVSPMVRRISSCTHTEAMYPCADEPA